SKDDLLKESKRLGDLITATTSQRDGLNTEIGNLTKRIDELEAKKDRSAAENAELAAKKSERQTKIGQRDGLNGDIRTLTGQKQKVDNDIKNLEADIAKLGKDIKDFKDDLVVTGKAYNEQNAALLSVFSQLALSLKGLREAGVDLAAMQDLQFLRIFEDITEN